MTNQRNVYKQSTAKNLSILVIVFFIGLGSQAILNLSISNFIAELDQKISNAHAETLIGEEIILEIQKMETNFFEMSALPNKHLRRILNQAILTQQTKIEYALNILNQGGLYRYRIDLNLPNTDVEYETLSYQPVRLNSFSFAYADIVPKFDHINQKLHTLQELQESISAYKATSDPQLSERLMDLTLEIKKIKPVFQRIKEDANRIFYQNKLDVRDIQAQVEAQKQQYRDIQIALTLITLILGLLIFLRLSRNIKHNLQEIQIHQDYTQDILDSQSNIIIVNDGNKIIDASGGFFTFLKGFNTLEAFAEKYDCICDLFIKEEGYVYKFEDQNWLDFLVENPLVTHKVKLDFNNAITTFQISAIKSGKYSRYIISMFDISDNERINADLKIEKNKALSATQAKGEFLANMSHEIRTPLNAILGFIALLKEKTLDTESSKFLNIIDSSSHSLLSIINDILDFSKIESGKLDMDITAFAPRQELSNIAELFSARCSEKNINFKLTLSDDLPDCIESDVLRIKQVIANLLSNAIKFTEPQKTVSLLVDYKDQHLICEVADQGIGMTPEFQARIFEAFSQAETSTTRKYGGTGLGLSISAKLVEALHGQLSCQSELNVGSTFIFRIPAKTCQAVVKPEAVQIAEGQTVTGMILLVEDNKTNQLLMSAIFKKQGLAFEIANDGLEAVAAIQKRHYDLILMDENMPNLNGIEATKQIRQLEATHALPYKKPLIIIAVTANAMTGDRERFIETGMDEYLAKPIKLPKLLELFQRFLPKSSAPD